MKMTRQHLDIFRDAIAPLDTPERRAAYLAAGLTDMRYRWDLLWAASGGGHSDLVGMVKKDLKDAHIDTALRSFIPTLGGPHEA